MDVNAFLCLCPFGINSCVLLLKSILSRTLSAPLSKWISWSEKELPEYVKLVRGVRHH